MIFLDLIKQQWQRAIRGRDKNNNILISIISFLFFVYFAGCLITLGILVGGALNESDFNPFQLFRGSLIYVVISGIAVRFFIQPLSSINLHVYQILPIKRNSLINYLLFSPLLNPLNYIALLFVLPFIYIAIVPSAKIEVALRAVLVFIEIIWLNIFIASYLKRRFSSSPRGIIGIFLFFAGLFAMEYYKVFSLFDISSLFFESIIASSIGWAIPLFFILAAFALSYLYLSDNFYSERFTQSVSCASVNRMNFSFFDRFGIIGEIISLQMKLIWRNKYPRKTFLPILILLATLIISAANPVFKGHSYILYSWMIMIVSLMGIAYGQNAFAWNGTHFEGIMTSNISIREYILSNVRIIQGFCLLVFIILTPIIYFGGISFAGILFSSLLVGVGFLSYIMVFIATFNSKRINIDKVSTFDTQGVGMKNFLIFIPLTLLGVIIWVLNMFFNDYIACIVVSLIGLLGVVREKQIVDLCVRQFCKRKHIMCESFRIR